METFLSHAEWERGSTKKTNISIKQEFLFAEQPAKRNGAQASQVQFNLMVTCLPACRRTLGSPLTSSNNARASARQTPNRRKQELVKVENRKKGEGSRGESGTLANKRERNWVKVISNLVARDGSLKGTSTGEAAGKRPSVSSKAAPPSLLAPLLSQMLTVQVQNRL